MQHLIPLSLLADGQDPSSCCAIGFGLFMVSLLYSIWSKTSQEIRTIKAAQAWRDRKSDLRIRKATPGEWEAWRAEGQQLLVQLRKIEHLRDSYRNEMNHVETDLRLYEANMAGPGTP